MIWSCEVCLVSKARLICVNQPRGVPLPIPTNVNNSMLVPQPVLPNIGPWGQYSSWVFHGPSTFFSRVKILVILKRKLHQINLRTEVLELFFCWNPTLFFLQSLKVFWSILLLLLMSDVSFLRLGWVILLNKFYVLSFRTYIHIALISLQDGM